MANENNESKDGCENCGSPFNPVYDTDALENFEICPTCLNPCHVEMYEDEKLYFYAGK